MKNSYAMKNNSTEQNSLMAAEKRKIQISSDDKYEWANTVQNAAKRYRGSTTDIYDKNGTKLADWVIANYESLSSSDKSRLLLKAIQCKHLNAVKAFVERNFDINVQDIPLSIC